MDNGACSYRRFLDGDDKGLVELVGEYKDGLILFLSGYVNNISVAEELTEETFFRLITKKTAIFGKKHFQIMAVCDRTKYGDRLYTTPFKNARYAL